MIRPSKRPRLLPPREMSELTVDIATLLPNNQLSRVQQFNFVQCRWQRGCWWEWARWTDSTGSNPAMDMPLLLSEQCSTHIHREPQRKEGQWSITHKWRRQSTQCFSSVFCRNYRSAGGGVKPLLTRLHRQTWRWTLSWTWRYWSRFVCVSGNDNTDETWCKRQIDGLLGNIGSAIHTFLWHHDEMGPIPSHPSLLTFYWHQEWNW